MNGQEIGVEAVWYGMYDWNAFITLILVHSFVYTATWHIRWNRTWICLFCRPDTLLTIGGSWQSDMFVYGYLLHSQSHHEKTETKKHKWINSLVRMWFVPFCSIIHFGLDVLGFIKNRGGCMWTCTICPIPSVSPSLLVIFSKLQNASNNSRPKQTRIKGFPDLEFFLFWACTHARL